MQNSLMLKQIVYIVTNVIYSVGKYITQKMTRINDNDATICI
jgi:hypothetical protein